MICRIWLVCALALTGCAQQPPVPDWQLLAHSAAQRGLQAYLGGADRVARQEWQYAREQTARTGDPARMARLELLLCAAQTASLVPEPCTGFEPLRSDAAPAELAYAQYLQGQPLRADQQTLLPAAQQTMAQAQSSDAHTRVAGMADPLAQLVAAAVVLRRGAATPALVQQAVDTSSRQGWRRPLLAWLGVQWRLAEQGGDTALAAQVRRRMDVVERPAQQP